MDDFDALLAELAPLYKALPADAGGEAKVLAAAEEAGADTTTVTGAAGGKEGAEDDVLGKSFSVTMPGGNVEEVIDATDLLKSFGVRLEAAETAASQSSQDLDVARGDLVKSLTATSHLVSIVKGQDALIKSLQADISRIGNQGSGRRAAVIINERNPAVPVETKPSGEQIMAKAMSLVGNGVSASDISIVEMSLQQGMPLPPHLANLLSPAA